MHAAFSRKALGGFRERGCGYYSVEAVAWVTLMYVEDQASCSPERPLSGGPCKGAELPARHPGSFKALCCLASPMVVPPGSSF